MSEEWIYRELKKLRSTLFVIFGIVGTLLITALIGDVAFSTIRVPCGWFGLWFLTTVVSIPLGIVILLGSSWRGVPLTDRQSTAIGYLTVGLINSVSLALLARWFSKTSYTFIILLSLFYGILLLIIQARLRITMKEKEEELFP